ncbi:MAG: hypothetical protein J6D23_05485 [Clostridia bacterium]|nr:hypothetical protein [Clostridia bacterium]
MNKNVAGTLIALAATGAVVAGASFALYKVMKKHLKFSVEILPDDIENENELTAAVDVNDLSIPKEEDEAEDEIEISFVEEPEEDTAE